MPCSALIEPPSSCTRSQTACWMRSRSSPRSGRVQRHQDVEVQVAVADMAERQQPALRDESGDQRHAALDQLGDPADRDRDVVADDLALHGAWPGSAPRASATAWRAAPRWRPSVASSTSPASNASASHASAAAASPSGRDQASSTSTYQGAAVSSGLRTPCRCAAAASTQPAAISSKLEISSAKRSLPWVSSETAASGDGTAANRVTRSRGRANSRRDGGGDDPEAALRPQEGLLQVVAGIVLAQRAQAVPDPAVAQHHLEAEHQLARHAVADDVDPAGVAGEVAADLAGPFAAEAEREQPARPLGRRLYRRQCAARLGHQPLAARVDRADPVEAGQAQDQLPAGMVGDAAADQPGVAALRHDRYPGAGRECHERRDLLGGARADDGCCQPIDVAPEIDLVGCPVARCAEYPLAPDDLRAPIEEAIGQGWRIKRHGGVARVGWTIDRDDSAGRRGGKRPLLTPSDPLGYRSARSKGRVHAARQSGASDRGRVRRPRADRLRHQGRGPRRRGDPRWTCSIAASCAWPRRPPMAGRSISG